MRARLGTTFQSADSSQLPALRHRPADQADRRLDAVHRPGLAGAGALRTTPPTALGHGHRAAVRPGPAAHPLRRQARRPLRQAHLLIGANAAFSVLALALGVLVATGADHPGSVFLFAALHRHGATRSRPRYARRSSPSWSARELLPNALSLSAATFNTARILGPAVAGVAIAPVGPARSSCSTRVTYARADGGAGCGCDPAELHREPSCAARPRPASATGCATCGAGTT